MRRCLHLLVVTFVSLNSYAETSDAFLSSAPEKSTFVKDSLATHAHLKSRVIVSSEEARLGVPTMTWVVTQPRDLGLRSQGVTAVESARRILAELSPLYHKHIRSIARLEPSHVHDTGIGAVVVVFKETQNGTPIFRNEVKIVLTQDFAPVAVAGYLTPFTQILHDERLSCESSIKSAMHAENTELKGSVTRASLDSEWYQTSAGDVRCRATLYPTGRGLEPAHAVELNVTENDTGTAELRSLIVSSFDGRILHNASLTQTDASFRVFADQEGAHFPWDGSQGTTAFSPFPLASVAKLPFVAQPPLLITVPSGLVGISDPWLAQTATMTAGNNVNAYADLYPNNGYTPSQDVIAQASAPGNFDYTFDSALTPFASTEQQMASVTQLFYTTNFLHDWYYTKGFDEKSGNAQLDNLGRGGRGNDPLLAEAQDYSGYSNANMSTPPDGASPRMQMFIFRSGENAFVRITQPSNAAYATSPAQFGPQSFKISAQVVQAKDATNATDGCNDFVGDYAGLIVVVDRGTCAFVDKARKAQAANAIGIILANNTNGPAPTMPGVAPDVTIPMLSISSRNAIALKALINSGPVSATLQRDPETFLDGALDNTIVAHEWGHYISNRLIGDGNGLSSYQSVGMGEGWADFHSLLMMVREEDAAVPTNANFTGSYAVASYAAAALSDYAPYYGLRRVPYSTDFSKNGFTFKHIQENQPLPTNVPTQSLSYPLQVAMSGLGNSETHNTGEVWATMLWECYAALLKDTQRLSFVQAQDRMMRYLVAAYKATPLMPTFVEARDALLAVAVANDAADFQAFFDAFARRGMGIGAIAPERNARGNTPVTESFSSGAALAIASMKLIDDKKSCDNDGFLDSGESGTLTVDVRNVGSTTIPNAQVTLTTDDAALVLSSVQGDASTATVGRLAPFESKKMVFSASLSPFTGQKTIAVVASATDSTANTSAGKRTQKFITNVNVSKASATGDDVEAPFTQWIVANNPAGNTGSNFRIYEVSPTEHLWFGPSAATAADTYLISPGLVVDAATQNFTISFQHRFEFEADMNGNYDGAVVEISTDGRIWSDIGSKATSNGYNGDLVNDQRSANPLRGRSAFVGLSAGAPALNLTTLELGKDYSGKTVLVRFRVGSDDAGAKKGWEIDNISFEGLSNKPFASVTADSGQCANKNRAPTLAGSQDATVNENQTYIFELLAYDADNDMTNIEVRQLSGKTVTRQGLSFVAPEVDGDELLEFEAVANDGALFSQPLQIRVTVKDATKPPETVSGPDEASAEAIDHSGKYRLRGGGCSSALTVFQTFSLLVLIVASVRRRKIPHN